MLFRRSKPETAEVTPATPDTTAGGKGRPTPTRKEAQAAARARARGAVDPRATKSQQRAQRAQQSRQMRQAVRDGDPRYLPARDQGPVKAFVRDFVDVRLNMAEFALPVLLGSLLLSSTGNPRMATLGGALLNAMLLIVVLDCLFLRWRMRRELGRRFPHESLKGTTFYALMRALQLRFLRLPKPRVRIGQRLPPRS